jgi:SAM-dependent methyltransferase
VSGWNHNIHYHDVVLRSVPRECGWALDAGCGTGLLSQKLAARCSRVVAMDLDAASLNRAAGRRVQADAMQPPFLPGSFDFIAAVATLHHLPLKPALRMFRDLLAPGGVLAAIGLYREQTLPDYVWAAAAVPASWALRAVRGDQDVDAPTRAPSETLREISQACEEILPGSAVKRRLFFRYSLVWRKPSSA